MTSEPIVTSIEPTGLAAKLQEAQDKCKKILEQATDITRLPGIIANLGWISTIVQHVKIVNLLGDIKTELQEAKVKAAVSSWIDAKGIYFLLVHEAGAIYTYLADGSDYTPIEPSRPVEATAIGATTISAIAIPPSEPKYIRRTGENPVILHSGAKRISISVFAGEVSCSNGDGVLSAGTHNLGFADSHGLGELIFTGDADADYVVWMQYPIEVAQVEVEPETAVIPELALDPPEQLLTGDLLPAVA
jgi:hypothetical protein